MVYYFKDIRYNFGDNNYKPCNTILINSDESLKNLDNTIRKYKNKNNYIIFKTNAYFNVESVYYNRLIVIDVVDNDNDIDIDNDNDNDNDEFTVIPNKIYMHIGEFALESLDIFDKFGLKYPKYPIEYFIYNYNINCITQILNTIDI